MENPWFAEVGHCSFPFQNPFLWGISISRVLVDAWYGNCPSFTKKLEQKRIHYITSLYANRRVYYQLPGEVARNEHRLGEVVTLLEAECFSGYV
jgi:hypothetical protein